MSESFRVIELPDTDREISRIVFKEGVIELARELKDKHGFSDEEIAQILDESSKTFSKK